MEKGKDKEERSFDAYKSSGDDTILQSNSPAVPSPSQASGERTKAPDAQLNKLGGETPGSDNPALDTTQTYMEGGTSTADMLLARESAEEGYVRQSAATIGEGVTGQDQLEGLRPDEYSDTDAGRPNWPNDRQEAPLDYMDSPRADMPLGSGSADTTDLHLKGRMDASIDRSSTQASAQESRSGLAPVGLDAAEDKYEEREFGRPTEVSEIETIAPKMVNLPDEEND